jgi:hypothetical protein
MTPLPRRTLLIAASLLPLALTTPSRAAPLAPALLREDLARFRHAVLRRHPRWHGHERLDDDAEAAFAEADAALQAAPAPGLSRQAAFALMSRVNPALRDAHTLLMPWLDGRAPDAALQRRLFPFGVELGADGALRLRSHWRHADGRVLAAGTGILNVNGVPADALLDRLAAHSHGETPRLRRHMLGLMWAEWLHSVPGWRDRFTVVLDDGRTLALDAASPWTATRVTPQTPSLDWPVPDVALLRVPSLDVDEAPEAFANAVAGAYAALRSRPTRALLVDLRGNTGGQSDAAEVVMRPLLDRPVALVSRARERLNQDNRGWFGWRGPAGAMREIDLAREGRVEPLPPPLRWSGRTAVLIDEMSYSATILLAAALRDHGRATLIGRPTGGHANQTGNMMPSRLPHSGFVAFVATRTFVRPSGDPAEQPLRPDITVTAADPHRDPVLQAAIGWARSTG